MLLFSYFVINYNGLFDLFPDQQEEDQGREIQTGSNNIFHCIHNIFISCVGLDRIVSNNYMKNNIDLITNQIRIPNHLCL